MAEKRRRAVKIGSSTEAVGGHLEEPVYRAVADVEDDPSGATKPPFSSNERARLVHGLASTEMRPYTSHLLKGATARHEIDVKVGRLKPYKDLAAIFNNPDKEFTNFFLDHSRGDYMLEELDPDRFKPMTTPF
mmetsp:Transcript_13003/g.36581  ORF Transcript_13003/g.36581 Transcript_13003/m.36581 type:complete len:133 (-) Transcript_13003:329-727(-)